MKFDLPIAGMLLVGLLAVGSGCADEGGLLIDGTSPGTSPTSGSSSPNPSPAASGDLSGRITDD